MRPYSLALFIPFLFLPACGKDKSGARVANMSQQEADALNDAAAIIDERTENVTVALNQLSAPQAVPSPQQQPKPSENPKPAENKATLAPATGNNVQQAAPSTPQTTPQNSAQGSNPQKK